MWYAKAISWACVSLGLLCGSESLRPASGDIQQAYEREASSANSRHDKGLRVLEAACSPDGTDAFLCQVTFISASDPAQRLYYDVVSLARRASQWQLTSGLCKR